MRVHTASSGQDTFYISPDGERVKLFLIHVVSFEITEKSPVTLETGVTARLSDLCYKLPVILSGSPCDTHTVISLPHGEGCKSTVASRSA